VFEDWVILKLWIGVATHAHGAGGKKLHFLERERDELADNAVDCPVNNDAVDCPVKI